MGKYNLDNFARDLAFEVNLGGGRFDREDVAACLDGMSAEELRCFADRVKYHALDFAPRGGYRDPSFLDAAVEGMLSDVRTGSGFGGKAVHDYIIGLNSEENRCRGRWYRFSDGTYGQCRAAATWAAWNESRLKALDPVPVTQLEVACAKAGALLDRYARDLVLPGGTYGAVGLLSGGGADEGPYMLVARAAADGGGSGPLLLVTREGGGKAPVLEPVAGLDPVALGRLVVLADAELERRWYEDNGIAVSSPAEGVPGDSGGSLRLETDIPVAAPLPNASGDVNFLPQRISMTPGGDAVVSGHYLRSADGGRRDSPYDVTFPLTDFSDAGISVIREATEYAVKRMVGILPRPDLEAVKGIVSRDGSGSMRVS